MSATAWRFRPGDRVRVRSNDRPGHVRTPAYIRERVGSVELVHGAFPNPEQLAYGQDGLPKRTLYLVAFKQQDVWETYGAWPQDKLYVDIYEHWLESACEGEAHE